MTRGLSAAECGERSVADSIAGLLRAHGLVPDCSRIAQLVQEHRNAFIDRLLVESGLQQYRDSVFVGYVRTIEDLGVIELIVRHHGALLAKLQAETTKEVSA